jgi:CheY-like chemotaxis protein
MAPFARARPKWNGLTGLSGMKATNESYSILITDDDRRCREALREIMEPEGFRTLQASSGEEALDIVQEEPVHLLLLDVHLPRLTGLETLQLVRQLNARLPCILVTGEADERLLRQAQQAHAYSVIPKPVSKNVVLYTVVRALVRFYGSRRGRED